MGLGTLITARAGLANPFLWSLVNRKLTLINKSVKLCKICDRTELINTVKGYLLKDEPDPQTPHTQAATTLATAAKTRHLPLNLECRAARKLQGT